MPAYYLAIIGVPLAGILGDNVFAGSSAVVLAIIGVPIAGILCYAGFEFYSLRKRTAAIKRWAEQEQFIFSSSGKGSFLEELSCFSLFSKGHIKKTKNLVEGESEDIQFLIFDYEYTHLSESLDMRSSVSTVFFAHPPKVMLPVFSLWPKSLYRKIAGKSGTEEISFEARETCFQSDLLFSKKYLLYGKDELALRRLFSDRLLGWLAENAGLRVEGADDRLVIYRPGKRLKAKDLPAFLDDGLAVVKMLQLS